MMRFARVALCLVALVSSAEAKKKSDALAEAKRLAKSGKYVEAVDLCASELATAQKKKDLRRELEIADVLKDDAFRKLTTDASNAKTYGLCLKALLLKLDPKKTSAVCSAGQVAHALLFHATRTGDMSHVGATGDVCAAYAKLSTGEFADVMVSYGVAMHLVATGEAPLARRSLSNALTMARMNGWSWASVHFATELAALHLAEGAVEEAAKAMAGAQTALQYTKDRAVFHAWRTMIGRMSQRAAYSRM